MKENICELIAMIKAYKPKEGEDKNNLEQLMRFIEDSKDVFGNTNSNGHITASAWIINSDFTKVLMTHHKKLNKWLQLGGHTEYNERIKAAALREALEESGLTQLELIRDEIFDIDVHLIPKRGDIKAHYHYDIRFVFRAFEDGQIIISDESNDLKWIEISELTRYTSEESILRMRAKTLML